MFGFFRNAEIKKLQKMLADEQDHVRELQQALADANKTTKKSVDNFTTLYKVYAEQRELINKLMRSQR